MFPAQQGNSRPFCCAPYPFSLRNTRIHIKFVAHPPQTELRNSRFDGPSPRFMITGSGNELSIKLIVLAVLFRSQLTPGGPAAPANNPQALLCLASINTFFASTLMVQPGGSPLWGIPPPGDYKG